MDLGSRLAHSAKRSPYGASIRVPTQLSDRSSQSSVAIEELEARMRPGRFSTKGFLGPNERLADVLARDAQTMAELSVTPHSLSEHLGALLEPVVASRLSSGRVQHYRIRLWRYKGIQICPFAPNPDRGQCTLGGGTRYASLDWRIHNTRTHFKLGGPGLIVHLIGTHGFFEGRESPYRVDPRALAELLELT
jgi:hypothetical protein